MKIEKCKLKNEKGLWLFGFCPFANGDSAETMANEKSQMKKGK
jgi:hypothetical protein